MGSTADPNFPVNLDISPLLEPTAPRSFSSPESSASDPFKQQEAINRYGIAGRVWEASYALSDYIASDKVHDPPCTLHAPGPHRIIELGSGQSLASLRLADRLSPSDTLILTDLPNVVPLCQQSIDNWHKRRSTAPAPTVLAEPLAWGGSIEHVQSHMPFSHILLCDLVYFPELYPPLLRTLLELTESRDGTESETFGAEVILAYHSRTLSLEESFFDALGQYFKLSRVTGGQGEAKLFVCKRWRVTESWSLPSLVDVMQGSKEVVQGRGYGLIDVLFGSLEW